MLFNKKHCVGIGLHFVNGKKWVEQTKNNRPLVLTRTAQGLIVYYIAFLQLLMIEPHVES